jgi:hypothetical protein
MKQLRSTAYGPCDDEGEGAEEEVDGEDEVAAAAFANLSTLSASLMCCAGGPGMLRKCGPMDELRLGVVADQVVDVADWEYGDSSARELLRDGMDRGWRYIDISDRYWVKMEEWGSEKIGSRCWMLRRLRWRR